MEHGSMKTFAINSFKKLALAALVVATFSSMAPAQELSPDHLALARRYVELTDKSNVYELTLIETGIATMRTIVSQNPDITDDVSTAIGEVIQQYADRKDELFDQFARIYALRLSQEELTLIVAFFESDVGRRLTIENVAANVDLETALKIFKNNLNREFFAAVRANLRDKGIDS